MSKTGWLKTTIALALLFAAGFVLVGNRGFERWLRGQTQRATTTHPASAADENGDAVVSLELGDESVEWVSHHRKLAAMVVMVLLGSDMFLPVPSSVVMTTNGRLFGFAAGTVVSFIGSMLAWIGCYWLGRLFGWTGPRKKDGESRNDLISRQVSRFGVGMLIATRPVPILAEITAAACGVARMRFGRFLAGSSLGVLPMSLVYAYVGNHYRDSRSPWVALAIAILIPLLLYLAFAQPWRKRHSI